MRRSPCALPLALAIAGVASAAVAQTAPPISAPAASSPGKAAARKKTAGHIAAPYQSPWATIMQSHLWTNVPEAQDFVRDSRPAAKDLKYTPLTSQVGADPARPKPRDAANVMALQAEMEASIAHNQARAGQGAKPRHHAKATATAD